MDHPDEVGFFDCGLSVMTTAGSELGHDHTHHEQAYRRFEVRAVTDGETLVRSSEEEIEPDCRRCRSEKPRNPRPQDGDGCNQGYEDEGCCGAYEGCPGGRANGRPAQ